MSTTKDDITQYAMNLIGGRSFSSFSYDDISREFNLTKAAVHYHFRNKEDLGVAVCDALREGLLAEREAGIEAARRGRHPWHFLKARAKMLAPGGICPLVSLQADFENLSDRLRQALAKATREEVATFCAVARAYQPGVDEAAVVALLLGLKGALQYRRVMGEKFFQQAAKAIKEQFFALLPRRAQG